jgi:hypothetical protein
MTTRGFCALRWVSAWQHFWYAVFITRSPESLLADDRDVLLLQSIAFSFAVSKLLFVEPKKPRPVLCCDSASWHRHPKIYRSAANERERYALPSVSTEIPFPSFWDDDVLPDRLEQSQIQD